MRTVECLAIATAVIALTAPSIGIAASTTVPVEPVEDELYPVLTVFTGPCTPEQPLPAPTWTADSDYQEERTLESVYSVFTGNGDDYDTLQPTGGPRNQSGPCRAYRKPETVGDVPAFRVEHTGYFHMTVIKRKQKYQSGSAGTEPTWVAPESPVDDIPRSVEFTVFDPCGFEVSGVSGTVTKFTTAKRTPVTVRPGDRINRGDILHVDRRGKAALSNAALGSNIGFGPGEYQFTSNDDCESAVRGRFPASMPTDLPPVRLKEGVIEQRGREATSTVKAAGDLLNDGIFSRLGGGAPRAAGAGGDVRFRVERAKRRKQTRSCALKGELRVTATSRSVPVAKRRLVVPQGRCALTRDRGAPNLLAR